MDKMKSALITVSVISIVIITLLYREIYLKTNGSSNMKSGTVTSSLKQEYQRAFSNNDPPNCSLRRINDFMIRNSSFPGQGYWENIHSSDRHFVSSFCELLPPKRISKHLPDYMKTAKPKKIVIMGDSMGRNYANAFLSLLHKFAAYNCTTIKEEKKKETGFKPDKSYYIKGTNIKTQTLVASTRTCRTCLSKYSQCMNKNTKHELDVEYISMTMFNNASIVPNKTYCQNKLYQQEPICSVSNQMEFLFKIYLKERFPDVMILFTTFAHATSQGRTSSDMKRLLPSLYHLIDNMAPLNTTILWVPTASADMSKLTVNRDKKYENGNNYEEQIGHLNHALYDTLKEELLAGKLKTKMYGFLDLYAMTKHQDLKRVWWADHVHFKGPFYSTVISYLVQTLHDNVVDIDTVQDTKSQI